MKDAFKKTFGIVMGIWAASVAANFLSSTLKKVTGDEDTSKKEESKFEEES